MKRTVAALAIAIVAAVGSAPASAQETHRARCHQRHTCPSDHATYRWGPRRLLCVKPDSDKRTARFKIRVRYAGKLYFCRR